jgi:subtilisin-like proprotein convertase family protein
MTFLLVGSFGLVSSNSNIKPQNPNNRITGNDTQTYNATKTDSLRSIYNNPDVFDQMSGAARSRLEMMFGKKTSKFGSNSPVANKHKNGKGAKDQSKSGEDNQLSLSPSYQNENLIGTLAAIGNGTVNNPAADATARNTQSETTIALAKNGNVVSSFNDSGSLQDPTFNTPNDHFTGYAFSTNGGTAFTDAGILPTTTNTGTGPMGDAGDPILAVDQTSGKVYLTTLAFTNAGIQVFASTDNGQTFGQPVNAFPGFSNNDFFDKEWIAVDNATGTGQGNVYVVSRDFSGSSAVGGIYFSRSTDGGQTFTVSSNTNPNIVVGQQGAFVTVGPDHSVYVFWYDSSSSRTIKMRKSTDFGVTFGSAVTVATLNGTGVNGDLGLTGGFRSNSFPQAVVSSTNSNLLYATFNDTNAGTDRGNIFVVASTNGGASWGSPIKVNDDTSTTAQQYGPTIALTPDSSRLFLSFYDRRRDPNNMLIDVYGSVQSVNTTTGALTALGSNFRITQQSFPVVVGVDPVINSTYMGDYDQAVADNSFFYVTWGDNRTGNPDVRFAKIPVNGPGATLAFSSATVVSDVGPNPNPNGNSNNGVIEPGENITLNVALNNSGNTTATGVSATLSTTTPGITVTQSTSAYPNIPNNGTVTNTTPFAFSVSGSFPCGTTINFLLTVTTTSDGTMMVPFFLTVGSPGAPMAFEAVSPQIPLRIPPVGSGGSGNAANDTTLSTVNVSGINSIAKVTVSLYATHTFDSDLVISLVAPDNTTVVLSQMEGGSGDNFGTSCSNRTLFDDAATTAISAGIAPFTGSFKPEMPLSAFIGKTGSAVNGTWTLKIQDTASGDTGNLMCWGLQISPFTCGGVSLDHTSIFVADTLNNRIQRSDNDGSSWVTVGFGPGTGPGQFNQPRGVSSSSNNQKVFVADTGNNRIQRSLNGGTSWTTIATAGTALGSVVAPQGVAYDENTDNLYIADTGNNRIVKVSSASGIGSFSIIGSAGTAIGSFNQPRGIAVDSKGLVYVADTSNNRIQMNTNGTTSGWVLFAGASAGVAVGQMNLPSGIYVATNGVVYVADTANNRIQANTGGISSGWSIFMPAGTAVGSVNGPQGVTKLTSGNVFIGDTLNNRIQKKPSTGGGSASVVGAPGTATGQFNGPTGVR